MEFRLDTCKSVFPSNFSKPGVEVPLYAPKYRN